MDYATFEHPKPYLLIHHLLCISSTLKDDLILDFFAGSCTTAHAVMQLNAEERASLNGLNSEQKGNRKWIMVQMPEQCSEKSEAYKAGYKNIAEIGKERIRRAIKKIETETGMKNSFKVLKCT